MRYLLVLDRRSVAGSIYDGANNDGHIRAGDLLHPVLDCLEATTEAPNYVFVKRDMSRQGKSHQSLYVPHSAIAYILCYADKAARPMGFIEPT